MNSKEFLKMPVAIALDAMLEKQRKKYFSKNNHVYCVKNGHHKRCYLVNGEWLCPICDKERINNG